jgi:eukaryotic-like serine/threonine-protein kinase
MCQTSRVVFPATCATQRKRVVVGPSLIIPTKVVALSPSARLGVYEVVAQIGEGGMGQVYRARDTKLNRDVALKILGDAFASDPDRLARFQREAQVLATLNHPHIAHIHGLEESGGTRALVMEFVEGEDLAERLSRGAIPMDEALPLAAQIAEALAAAHEQGIIHRDLKPANIKVRADGTVKVLDFGLAKALERSGDSRRSSGSDATRAGAELLNSPAITSPAQTIGGMILGTAAYMAPEQAKGKPLDRRADIWAFGSVLYEMLAGVRAFSGADIAETLAKILEREPDWQALPPNTPAQIHRVLRRCLRKDPRRRLADISDARLEIEEALAPDATSQPAIAPRRVLSTALWLGLAVLAAALAFAAGRMQAVDAPSTSLATMRLDLSLPNGVELQMNSANMVALSRDGRRLAFVGIRDGVRQVYTRRLDQFEATPIQGTQQATSCFLSPDGTAIAFMINTSQTLNRVSLADGLVVTLAGEVESHLGGVWGSDDRITFVRASTLWQVPATGGPAVQLTHLDGSTADRFHAWPAVVPGRNVVLFAVASAGERALRIEALSLDSGRRHVVVQSATSPHYAGTGQLVFGREGALFAASFDPARLELAAQAARVVDNVAVDSTGSPFAAIADSHALVYVSALNAASQLVWVSRQGLEEKITDVPRGYTYPRVALDARRIVVHADNGLWIQDTARNAFTRLTSTDVVGSTFPVWVPDGQRVVFRGSDGLRWLLADGSGRGGSFAGTSTVDYPMSVSPDGKTLAFLRLTAKTGGDLYRLSLVGDADIRPMLSTPAYESGAQFSPDGRWIAYVSDESGRFEVYVRPFEGTDRRWQVSTQGGTHPRWGRDGKELFYRIGQMMMSVDVTRTAELAFSTPRMLFERRYAFATQTIANYDLSADGKRFVMVKDDMGSGRLNLVLNWLQPSLRNPR